uniref:Cystinosin homolog n=1 Tax=Caenorhabditis tropicalis TaxID=1561998 RepID=A0A1I7UR40_9PELO
MIATAILLILSISSVFSVNNLVVKEKEIEILQGEQAVVQFQIRNHSSVPLNKTLIFLSQTPYLTHPEVILLDAWTSNVTIQAELPVAGAIVEALNCTEDGALVCPLDLKEAYTRVTVIRSHWLAALIQIVGWTYFAAWSVSFYPQIYLNFKRKSVVGLNFDFLSLNLVGFGAYAIFNLLMYSNSHVKQIYAIENPRSPPPVLLNDVVFAVHAFLACLVTILQCVFYERDNQSVSSKCIALIIALLSFGFLSVVATVLNKISILAFVTSLSYIKMAVTCCKYFPQAYFNYSRRSTVGWSIGNILLDFTGGSLDILQMVLQAINVDDWSAFYANPVKFGLGFVSIFFDIIFMIQHYVLYPDAQVPHNTYHGVDNPEPDPIVRDAEQQGSGDTDSMESTDPIIVHD